MSSSTIPYIDLGASFPSYRENYRRYLIWLRHGSGDPNMPTQLTTIRKDFKHYTEKIKKDPHNPLNWIIRAIFFLRKYPEIKNQWPLLAVGDAYKAYQYFCNQSFRVVHKFEHIPNQKLQNLKGQACNILVPALLELGAAIEAKQFVDGMTVPLSIKHRRILEA